LAIEEQFGISLSEDETVEIISFVDVRRLSRAKGIEI